MTADHVILDNLVWSKWTLVFIKTDKNQRHLFRERKRIGKKRMSVFRNKCSRPTIYEFSVQTKPYKKKVAVYARITKGFEHRSWERTLLGFRVLQHQLDNVLSHRCRVYIRRANLRIRDKVRAARALKKLDYAWTDGRGTGKHRRLFVEKVPISLEFQQRQLK